MSHPIDPFKQNQLLGRGVNIIGYDSIWHSRDQGRFQPKHFRLIREAGFNHVRINLHPFQFMDGAPEYTIQPAWLDTLDWAVRNSLENDLLVILDMHEYNAIGENPDLLRPKYLATWRQLAQRYRNMPDSVLFELLNEPSKALTPEMWNEYYKEPYAFIRETNPERTLMIGPGFWNGIDHLPELELPEQDRSLIVAVHYYHPLPFTHQGAPWSQHRDQVGVRWLGTPEEQQAVNTDLERGRVWAEQHHRPLYLGEFGAYDRGDMESRVRYTSYVARRAESLGWSWGYWQFDSDFIVYDIPGDCWVEPILDALIPHPNQAK
jgi:endoglucanase